MRWLFSFVFLLSTISCHAQIQKWQRERAVDHLNRLKSYQGHFTSKVGDESSESDIWFQSPNHFVVISKNGETIRDDGSTMEIYDPKSRLHSIFKNLPSVSESDRTQLLRHLFDEDMDRFIFTLGPIGKVAGFTTIETRAKPRNDSIVQNAKSQVYDEFSFPLTSTATFRGGASAQYEFSKISFNQNFELPKGNIPGDAVKIVWDFKSPSTGHATSLSMLGLKLEKSLQHELGMTLNYYRNGAEFLSVIRYKNLGNPPHHGLAIKVGNKDAYLFPGLAASVLTVSSGDTTSVYTSNLLIDDLVKAATQL